MLSEKCRMQSSGCRAESESRNGCCRPLSPAFNERYPRFARFSIVSALYNTTLYHIQRLNLSRSLLFVLLHYPKLLNLNMDRFFPKITKDAYEAEMAKQSSAIIKSMEDQQERARQRIKDKEAELQARKRRNQQEVRARRKNAEILSGTRTSEGKRIPKRTSHTLLPHQRPTRYIDMPSVTRPPSSARTQRPCRINKPQKRTNWFSKTVWVDIQESAIRNRYSARHIANDLATRFPAKFSTLRDSTIQNWIEPKSSPPRWSNKVLEKIERGVGWVPGEGRIPLLDRAGYTELKEGFIEALKGMFYMLLMLSSKANCL